MTFRTTEKLAIAAFSASTFLFVETNLTDLRYILATIDGERVFVRDDRQPALLSADYDDCLGDNSLINVTGKAIAHIRKTGPILGRFCGGESVPSLKTSLYTMTASTPKSLAD